MYSWSCCAFSLSAQPFREHTDFERVADAFNGARDALSYKCVTRPRTSRRSPSLATTSDGVLSFTLPSYDEKTVVFADPLAAAVTTLNISTGSREWPIRTLHAAVAEVRRRRAIGAIAHDTKATIVLRAGTFYLGETLELHAEDSHIDFVAYPGERVEISGGVPLFDLKWTPVAVPNRDAFESRRGTLDDGFDLLALNKPMTAGQASQVCEQTVDCAGFVHASLDPTATAPCVFKSATLYIPPRADHPATTTVYVRNFGYGDHSWTANQLYKADVSLVAKLPPTIDALRVNGTRMILARYPNVRTVELLGAMQVVADDWQRQWNGTDAEYTFEPSQPERTDLADGFFSHFKLGVGGGCAFRFTPAAGYWCSNSSQGGGPGPYQAPVGMRVTSAPESLPHSASYQSSQSLVGGRVHTWRADRWFSWVFEIDDAYSTLGASYVSFSLARGGNQGSRGGDAGQEFFVDNVFDELDAPGEFYFDPTSRELFLWLNASTGTLPPTDGSIVVPVLTVLVNSTGTQQHPVTDISFRGIVFRDAAPNYLGKYGTPSGGDWGLARSAAVLFEGSERALIDGCLFTQLDSNGVLFSGYNRQAVVTRSEFAWIGETAIAQWGYTDGSPVATMGFDGSRGDQPRGTEISFNLVREVGLFTKQNSFFFQAESMQVRTRVEASWACLYACVRLFFCVFVCMHVSMCVCIYARVACMYVWYACMRARMRHHCGPCARRDG
jgi:hypothetical protein